MDAIERRHIAHVRRIAVLRPNAVGDFIFLLPALAALRAAYPQAHITLLGRPWHRRFLHGRPGPWDEVIAMPAVPGVGAPPQADFDPAAIERFVAEMRARRFDIALQLYGGGRHSNPFVQRLGARVCVGAQADDAPPLDRTLRYEWMRNERTRLLEVVGLVGATPVDLAPPLALTDQDEAERVAALPLPPGPCVVLQPGASDPRRRWSPQRFAAVGDALAAAGATVIVQGDASERALTAEVAHGMSHRAIDAGGLLGLGALAALLGRAALLVANDTGPLHLAHALGCPSLGLFWWMNLHTAEPLVLGPMRTLYSARTHCPVCGAENVFGGCEHAVSFIDDIPLERVRDEALAMVSHTLRQQRPAAGRVSAALQPEGARTPLALPGDPWQRPVT